MNPILYKKYCAAEKYFESLGGSIRTNKNKLFFNTDFSLSRMRLLLQLTENPDRAFKIIHIAGTSGKGTVTNYIYNILQQAGYKVGAHFSPFVSVATEKIQINNKFISVQEFIRLVDDLKPIIKQCTKKISAPSYFEVWILAALVYFKKKNCDYVVLETGCGGRFDATNAVHKTIVSVITNIGLDHTNILGKTISKIAYEKAGITRKHGIVFTAANRKHALTVIKKSCREQHAKLFVVKDKTNCDLASAVTRYQKINEQSIAQGLMNAKLPARFEIVQQNPLIILDGAHNPDKLAYLAAQLHSLKQTRGPGKTHLICALTAEKNIKQCFKKIIKEVDFVYCTRPLTPVRSFVEPKQLMRELKKIKTVTAQSFLNPRLALRAVLTKAAENDLIIITGSFFLCGDLRSHWINVKKQLEQRTNFPK
ncbi:MAG: Mur ligase family protein [Patescibacteria group bacterium]